MEDWSQFLLPTDSVGDATMTVESLGSKYLQGWKSWALLYIWEEII